MNLSDRQKKIITIVWRILRALIKRPGRQQTQKDNTR